MLTETQIQRLANRRYAQSPAVEYYLRNRLNQPDVRSALIAMAEFVKAERLNVATYRTLQNGVSLAYSTTVKNTQQNL